jgi:hypothetical protein
MNLPWPNPRFIQSILPDLPYILPPCRLRIPSRNEMTRHIETYETPSRERAVATRQVLRLHPESFPIPPSYEITARRRHIYRLRRSHRKCTWAICWPRTSRCVRLLMNFIFRRLLSRGDGTGKEVIFPNRVAVVGCDSHENSDRIKLPSFPFLFCHLVNDDNSFYRRVLNMQESSESTHALHRTSSFVKPWGG